MEKELISMRDHMNNHALAIFAIENAYMGINKRMKNFVRQQRKTNLLNGAAIVCCGYLVGQLCKEIESLRERIRVLEAGDKEC